MQRTCSAVAMVAFVALGAAACSAPSTTQAEVFGAVPVESATTPPASGAPVTSGPEATQPRPRATTPATSRTQGSIPANGDLRVEGAGFSRVTRTYGSDTGVISWGCVLENTSTTDGYEHVNLDVRFLDADGNEVANDSTIFGAVLPGQRVAISRLLETSDVDAPSTLGDVDRIEVTPRVDSLFVQPTRDRPNVTTGEFTLVPADNGSSTVEVDVSSSTGQPIVDYKAVVILYDAGGNVLGGSFSFPTEIPATGTHHVVMDLGFELPDGYDHFEVIAFDTDQELS